MAGLFQRISMRLPILRGSSSLATLTATDLTPNNEELINAMSSNGASLPIASTEPVGVPPCAVDVLSGSPVSRSVVEESANCPASSNSRHHHRRHHRRSRRHRLCKVKCKDINFLSAMCCVIVVVLVCTSLYEPHWWYIGGSHCRDSQQNIVSYLSVRPFFFEGYFVTDSQQQNAYFYGTSQSDVLRNCVTPHSVYVIKSIVILCFVVIVLNMAAIFLDVVLFANRCTKALRTYAVFPILSVCTCVTINLLSYVVTQQLFDFFQSNPDSFAVSSTASGFSVDVQFSLCFYVIMASGVVSVVAVASTLLCRRGCSSSSPSSTRRSRDHTSLSYRRSFLAESLPSMPPPYEP